MEGQSMVISRSMAYLYKKELNTGKYNASGRELSDEEKTFRTNAIANRACTLQPRYRKEEDQGVADKNSEKHVYRFLNYFSPFQGGVSCEDQRSGGDFSRQGD